MRHVLLKIATGEACKDAEDYEQCAAARWSDLYAVLASADSPFYRNVQVVDNIECEAMYEHEHGLVFELLISLESTTAGSPDISKPILRKAVVGMFAAGEVLLKKVVPPPPPIVKAEPI